MGSERRGLFWATVLIVVMTCGLAARVVYLQVFRHGFYMGSVAPLLERREHPELVRPGLIYDQRLRVLADSQTVADIVADPQVLAKAENLDEIRQFLVSRTGVDPQRFDQVAESSGHFAYLARRLPAAEADLIAAQRFSGVRVERGFRRSYPFGSVACHLLGAYSADQRPLEGLDLQYRFVVQGRPGTPRRNQDAFGRTIVGMEGEASVPPVPGKSLVTTVDLDLQRTVEDALDRLLSVHRPASATVVVMEPRTGAILALASRPHYDPNDISAAGAGVVHAPVSRESLSNLPVTWQYEPGSTFKVISAAAALEHGAVTPGNRFYCGGTIPVGGRPLRCWGEWAFKGHGSLDLGGILAKSCNLGAAQVAMKLGAEPLVRFLRDCGFGERTGVGLPGEASGKVYAPSSLRVRDLANMGFGQHVSVTPLQLAAAVSAIVNDGHYMQPHVVRQVLNPDGSVFHETSPFRKRSVCSAETSRRLRQMMTGVVEQGTGRAARIPGVAVGGKTGTAQVWDPVTRSYAPSQRVVSFVLVAPSDRIPDFCILVTAMNPQVGEHGAEVAAPAAKEIALYLLRQKGLAPAAPKSADARS